MRVCKDAALCAALHTQIYDLYVQLSVPQTLCSTSRESSFLSAPGANSGVMLEAFLTQRPLAEVKFCAMRVVLGAVIPLSSAELSCSSPGSCLVLLRVHLCSLGKPQGRGYTPVPLCRGKLRLRSHLWTSPCQELLGTL